MAGDGKGSLGISVDAGEPLGRPESEPFKRKRLAASRWTVLAGSAIPAESRSLPSRESKWRGRRLVFNIGTSM